MHQMIRVATLEIAYDIVWTQLLKKLHIHDNCKEELISDQIVIPWLKHDLGETRVS